MKDIIKKFFEKVKNIKVDKRIILVLMTFFTLSTLFISLKFIDISTLKSPTHIGKFFLKYFSTINGYSVVFIPLFISIYYFYSKTYFDGKKINPWIVILSAFMAFTSVLGYSYDKYNSWNVIFSNYYQFAMSISIILGYYFAFYICIKKFYQFVEKYKEKEERNKIFDFIFEKHPIIVPATIIIICWLPYIISFFPGTTPGTDTIRQLYEYYGIIGPTGHPYAHTFIIGNFAQFGDFIGSRNTGLFLYIVLQIIILATIFGYTFKLMKEYKTPKFIRIVALLLYCFLSFFVLFAINYAKDTLFSGFMLVYLMLLFIGLTKTEKFNSKKYYIFLAIIMLLIMLFRQDGLYRILLSFPFYIIANKKYWKKLIIVFIVPIIINYSFNSFVVNKIVYKDYDQSGSYLGKYVVIYQQIARVVHVHGIDAFAKEDIEIIKKVIPRYEELGEVYTPTPADPVTRLVNTKTKHEDFNKFLGVWIKYIPKYGLDYVQATLNNTYGYFYPNRNNDIGYLDIKTDWIPEYGNFNFYMDEDFAQSRFVLEKTQRAVKRLPVIGMFYSVGFYIYTLLIFAVYALYKKNFKQFTLAMPGLATLLICLTSPVNGHWRYSLPIIFSFPFMMTILFYYGKNSINAKKKQVK